MILEKLFYFLVVGEFGLGKNKTLKLLNDFIKYAPNEQIVAISGKNENMRKNFEEIANNSSRPNDIKILGYSNQIPELMSISNLVVTKPGRINYNRKLSLRCTSFSYKSYPWTRRRKCKFLRK